MRLFKYNHCAAAVAMVDVDDLDADQNLNWSTLEMDGKLIDDRQACAGAIEDGNQSLLIQLLKEVMVYMNSELAEARLVTIDLLWSTD